MRRLVLTLQMCTASWALGLWQGRSTVLMMQAAPITSAGRAAVLPPAAHRRPMKGTIQHLCWPAIRSLPLVPWVACVLQDAEAAQRQYVQLRREHEALQNSINNQVSAGGTLLPPPQPHYPWLGTGYQHPTPCFPTHISKCHNQHLCHERFRLGPQVQRPCWY